MSSPYKSIIVSSNLPFPDVRRFCRPSTDSVKPTSGKASAYWLTTSATWPASVGTDFKNFSLAGTLRKSPSTVTVVPGTRARPCFWTILAVFQPQVCPGAFASGAGQKLDVSDGGNAGQGLAAEAERVDFKQISGAGYLARGVPLESEGDLAGGNAGTVIGDF